MSEKRRAPGEGTICWRKDGRWEVAVYVRTLGGARRRRRVYAKTKQEAIRKHRALLAQAERGLPDRDRKLDEYLGYWLAQYVRAGKRFGTYRQYERASRLYLVPALGKHRIGQLTVAALQRYFNGLLADGSVSVRQAQIVRTTLSACLTCAMREELVYRNVARLVQLPQSESRPFQTWNREEGMAFLAAARSDWLYPAFLLLMFRGLRRGELLGLRWRDVDFERGVIHIRQQLQRIDGSLTAVPLKTRASVRDLPLGLKIQTALLDPQRGQAALRDAQRGTWRGSGEDDELVFTSRIGTPVQDRTLGRVLRRICSTHGIRVIRVHDLRHFFATMLKDLGVPARDTQFLLGHASSWTTSQIYQHDDMQSRVAQTGKLDDLLDAGEHSDAI